MTMLTRCDLCGHERFVEGAEKVDGWASVHIFSPKVGVGKRGPSEHLDLCPQCATDLRVWVGERMARRVAGG